MQACKDPWGKTDQAAVVEVQGVEATEAQEGVRSNGL